MYLKLTVFLLLITNLFLFLTGCAVQQPAPASPYIIEEEVSKPSAELSPNEISSRITSPIINSENKAEEEPSLESKEASVSEQNKSSHKASNKEVVLQTQPSEKNPQSADPAQKLPQKTSQSANSAGTLSSNNIASPPADAPKPLSADASENETAAEKPKEDASKKESPYKDGIYRGSAEGRNGSIEVQVEIEEGKIKKIEVLSHQDTKNLAQNVFRLMTKDMLSSQGYEVNVISGATVTSDAYKQAVKNALNSALNK